MALPTLALTPEELKAPPTCAKHPGHVLSKLDNKGKVLWSCGEPGTNPDSAEPREKYCQGGWEYMSANKPKGSFQKEDPLKTYQILCENAYTTAASLVLHEIHAPLTVEEFKAAVKRISTTGNYLATQMDAQAKRLLAARLDIPPKDTLTAKE